MGKKGRENLKMRKEEKGITLVALIITIVIMLILVAVSINILINSNLIGHAEKTGEAYAGAIKNEENLGNDGITINDKKYGSLEEYLYGKGVVANSKIGNYVNYKSDYDNDENTKDDWRVFYNDGKNVYLISSDYTEISVKLKSEYNCKNEEEALAFLLNEEIWGERYGNELAKYVHGGPTKEMFLNSYNSKYPDGDVEDDTLYNIWRTNERCCGGMWLATIEDGGWLARTMNGGPVTDMYTDLDGVRISSLGYMTGIRPIVCLKENVIITDGNGTLEQPYELSIK